MYNNILDLLPYRSSFRFVDEISFLDADKVIGHYTLRENAFFYEDHFPGNPVTPGAILTEIMAQIGLVTLGIYLITTLAPGSNAATGSHAATAPGDPNAASGPKSATAPITGLPDSIFPLLSSANVEFFKLALPGEKLTVTSKKDYFRFDKLKCHVEMHNAGGERIAKGIFSGFVKHLHSL